MKLGELLQNRNFDVNCGYRVYACYGDDTWDSKKKPDCIGVCGSVDDEFFLNLDISYMTIDNGELVIEVR